jgi:hypothetical protein
MYDSNNTALFGPINKIANYFGSMPIWTPASYSSQKIMNINVSKLEAL